MLEVLKKLWDSLSDILENPQTVITDNERSNALKAIAEVQALFPAETKPIPMILWCPTCKQGHLDKGIWATKPHKTHRCENCAAEWRPANVPTVGVSFLPQA